MTEAINIAKSANSSGTQQLRSWSKATSKIYQTKIASWTVEQVKEWLFDFVRVPHSYGDLFIGKAPTGSDVLALDHLHLKQIGIPWGLASHISDAVQQLRLYKDGVFDPLFVDARPYQWPFNGNLTTENTALIIIDMQQDFVGPAGYVAKMYGEQVNVLRKPIEPLQRLLATLRPLGFTIMHTREGHNITLTDCPANKRWRSEGVGGGIGSPEARYVLTKGTEMFDIIPELYPAKGEDVIDKPGKGSFYQTELDLLLHTQGIKNLIVAGVTTDVCCHTTMRDANDRGYECLLLEDGTAAVDPTCHAAAIEMVHKQGGVFGATATVDQLIAAVSHLKPKAK